MMEMLGAHGFCSLNSRPGAFDIGGRLGFFVCAHVVDRGKMEYVVNISFQ